MVNNISLCKLLIGVKIINGHSGVNFSFKVRLKQFHFLKNNFYHRRDLIVKRFFFFPGLSMMMKFGVFLFLLVLVQGKQIIHPFPPICFHCV